MISRIWGLATCAIVVISLAGLLVVSMIPFLRKMLMTSVLQFLVALAVGALSGDALLHLIPHSLQPHKSDNKHDDSDDATHFEGVYKGLCGLAAIYFFVIFGRLQSIIANRKRTKTNRSVKILNVDQDDSHQNKSFMSSSTEKGEEFEKDMIKIELNEIEEHSHGHSHGHSHSVPSSIPALAWRVIIGDGVHNLCDGLAIGVAFANSVTGGISTSIAVLCHELPHEMGDFAVLLTKGMSVKQAILCNCISSMLSLIGMFIGVILGNFGEANLWLFFAVAGMFLYISLVDLIPELSHVQVTGTLKSFKTLLVQISGMITGSGVMFLIAMFEDDLKTALEF
ncbi:hypothetical protein KUTeg_015467 [Tegillarca granosa]|uniref:Zinc transporter ZIP10 n=1 Tax=Tegillarca granosa TaxID=220873 RepID=A0ABQ9EQ84_TEGGR|nr:hypothetical protein KUTeg_015467 [Tegillarca granosa]